jgi:predicted metal-dependent hydrolase
MRSGLVTNSVMRRQHRRIRRYVVRDIDLLLINSAVNQCSEAQNSNDRALSATDEAERSSRRKITDSYCSVSKPDEYPADRQV